MQLDLIHITLVLIVILFSMTLHEAMHAYMGSWLGDKTAMLQGRLTLNPIKHIDPFMTIILPLSLALVGAPIFGGAKPVPFNPNNVKGGEWGAALIAIMGPLTNLFIAFIAFSIWALVGIQSTGLTSSIFSTIVLVNLGFFVFNMIPLTPLDGSRVLYALAPEFIRRLMEKTEKFGVIFIFALIIFANDYIGTLISSAIGFFWTLFVSIFI